MPGYGSSDNIAYYMRENEQLKAENGSLRTENANLKGQVQRLNKALIEASRVTLPDRSLTAKINVKEQELNNLYMKRRGTMIDDYYGWCCVCGRHRVAVRDGLDTCEKCLRRPQ